MTTETSAQTPLHFARFEFKYVLSAKKRKEVESDLFYFLDVDPFAKDIPDNRYFVRSLYFDDPVLSSHFDKIDGLKTRSKFRLRTYTRDLDDPAPKFLEIKGRHNNLVFKHRTPIDGDGVNWCNIRGTALAETLLSKAQPSDIRDQFAYEFYRKRLQPVALIDYRRRPYVSKYDPGFRVTFDEELQVTHTDKLFPGHSVQPRWIMPGRTVIEVKFRHHLPSWFHRVIQAHELQRRSISKICSGLTALGISPDE